MYYVSLSEQRQDDEGDRIDKGTAARTEQGVSLLHSLIALLNKWLQL